MAEADSQLAFRPAYAFDASTWAGLNEAFSVWDELDQDAAQATILGAAQMESTPAQAQAMADKLEPAAADTKPRKGLTPAQLRASRNFRARRKQKVAEMMEEVKAKQQLVAQLEAEQRRLKARSQVLEVVVAGSEHAQAVLQQQLNALSISDDSTHTAKSDSSSMDQQDSHMAVGRCISSISTGASGTSAVSSNSTGSRVQDMRTSGSSFSSRSPPDQGHDEQIDPDVVQLANRYTYFVNNARPLLHLIDAGTAEPGMQEEVERLMADLHNAFERLALKNRTTVYQLGDINMQTLARCDAPPEAHWRRVLATWRLPAETVDGLLLCYSLYEARRSELLRHRAQLGKALAQAAALVAGAAERDLNSSNESCASNSSSASDAARLAYEELVAEMDRSLHKEHVMEHTFQSSAYKYLRRIDVARLCATTYPFKHDLHKIVALLRQQQQQQQQQEQQQQQ